MAHICKNLLIRCMDYRLNGKLGEWINNSGLFAGGYDVISVAGAGKHIADGSLEELADVGVSANLHQVENVILVHHSDCGAYQCYNFSSPEEEKKKQFEDMEKVKQKILEKYPSVKVIKVWAELKDPEGKEIEFILLSD